MIYRIDVGITAPVKGTEIPERVETAVRNVFPNATLTREADRIVGETHSLDHFSELLHRQEILDTARNAMSSRRSGPYFSFSLKKGPAFEGVVNFAVGESNELGEIDVEVRVEEPSVEEFVDHVAPPTEDGRPITE
ncbi:coaE operon protein [Natronorarus salvus]|uniref:coaE operon protein n=1 Tax=Natronorarus salvus TaxID=3117733 RepID=UPI002F26AF98